MDFNWYSTALWFASGVCDPWCFAPQKMFWIHSTGTLLIQAWKKICDILLHERLFRITDTSQTDFRKMLNLKSNVAINVKGQHNLNSRYSRALDKRPTHIMELYFRCGTHINGCNIDTFQTANGAVEYRLYNIIIIYSITQTKLIHLYLFVFRHFPSSCVIQQQ